MNYFDRQAENYLSKSQSGLWMQVRKIERKAILDMIAAKPGEKILDVGCGAGFYAQELNALGAEVSGIDSSAKMIEQFCALGFKGVVGEFDKYSFEKQFDKVLIAGAGEFISDLDSILLQLSNVLKPGGSAVILAPRSNLFGRFYQLWHRSHGCKVSFHNYSVAIKESHPLSLTDLRAVTPMSMIVRLELQLN